jgi:hypothetical protein
MGFFLIVIVIASVLAGIGYWLARKKWYVVALIIVIGYVCIGEAYGLMSHALGLSVPSSYPKDYAIVLILFYFAYLADWFDFSCWGFCRLDYE